MTREQNIQLLKTWLASQQAKPSKPKK